MKKVKIECRTCGGTGLYSLEGWPAGKAAVCCGCDGTGRDKQSFMPFVRRKGKRGIDTVHRTLVVDAWFVPTDESVTYAEFGKGKMPESSAEAL